jgi:hypothetical protein
MNHHSFHTDFTAWMATTQPNVWMVQGLLINAYFTVAISYLSLQLSSFMMMFITGRANI